MLQASYSAEGVQGLLSKPHDRKKAVSKVIKAAGGTLKSLYYATGDYDVVVIIEMPDMKAVVSAIMAVAGSGSLGAWKTTPLMTSGEAAECMTKAGKIAASYRAPGS
jgi:uncharacterized protein with GYD domain